MSHLYSILNSILPQPTGWDHGRPQDLVGFLPNSSSLPVLYSPAVFAYGTTWKDPAGYATVVLFGVPLLLYQRALLTEKCRWKSPEAQKELIVRQDSAAGTEVRSRLALSPGLACTTTEGGSSTRVCSASAARVCNRDAGAQQALPGEQKTLSGVRTKTGKTKATTAAIPSSRLSANAAAVHQTSEAEAARVWRRVLTVGLGRSWQGRHRNGGARRRLLV